uniref:Uncharacterized protein n=1 Tax=Meloidogyne javanica TaxID=6303 RepID=A0A915LRM3_MELJA
MNGRFNGFCWICGCLHIFADVLDGNYCMTAGSDKSVKLWNPYKRIHLNTY